MRKKQARSSNKDRLPAEFLESLIIINNELYRLYAETTTAPPLKVSDAVNSITKFLKGSI